MTSTEKEPAVVPTEPAEEDPTLTRRNYMDRYVNYCRLISMWPRSKENFIRYWLVFVLMVAIDGTMLAAMFMAILSHTGNVDGLAEIVDYATAYGSSLFRYVYTVIRGKKFAVLVNYMHDNFVHSSFGPGKKLTLDKHVKMSRFICIFYMVLINVWLAHGVLVPYIVYYRRWSMRHENGTLMYPEERVHLPVDVNFTFDVSLVPNLGVKEFLHIFSFYSLSAVYVITDAFWFSNMILATGQFELITHSLRSLQLSDDEEANTDPKEVEKVVNVCMVQHQRTREFVHLIEGLMHPMVLVDFLHAVTSISFILVDITIAIYASAFDKAIYMGEYFIVSVFHMWVLDYFGNELRFKEQEITTAVYETPWYRYPKNLKGQVLVMAMLARNPCRLTGGKLYVVSLEFFAGTMKTIFSYLMVLLQLREA